MSDQDSPPNRGGSQQVPTGHAERPAITHRARWDDVRDKKVGPGGAANAILPALTPEMQSEDSVKIDHAPQNWTDEVRRAAFIAVRVAALRRGAGDRTLRYFLSHAAAHGLTTVELCEASGLEAAEVMRLTEPAAA